MFWWSLFIILIRLMRGGRYLGTDVPIKFPQIHAATGRDTTSFLHVVGKIKVSQWKRKAEASKQN